MMNQVENAYSLARQHGSPLKRSATRSALDEPAGEEYKKGLTGDSHVSHSQHGGSIQTQSSANAQRYIAYAQSEAVPFVVRTAPYTTNNHSVNGLSTWCIVADYLTR